MFNKNFFLGVLTTLLVVAILAVGGLFALRARAGIMMGGRPGGFEQRSDRQVPPGKFEGRGQPKPGDNRFEGQGQPNPGDNRFKGQGQPNPGDNRFEGDSHGFPRGERGQRHAGFSLLRGLGGILGSALIIGLIIGAVIGGQKLFKRFWRSAPPAPAAGLSTPIAPIDAPDEPLAGESPKPAEPAEFPAAEPPAVESPESVEPAEFPAAEPPAETPAAGEESPAEPPVDDNN